MTQKVGLTRRTGVRRLASRYSVLLVALILSASLLTTVMAADVLLDPSFDTDGIVTTDQNEFDQINDIAIQPDGKIVAAGYSGILHDSTQEPLSIMIVRYNTDGSLDATFGSGGIVTTAIGTYAKAWAVAVQADGKLVIGARSGTFLTSDFTLVRYNPNGSLDASFGTGGIVVTSFGDFSQIQDVAIQSDGKIVATGDAPSFGTSTSLSIFTVARYNTDGSLDATFAGDGVSQAIPAGFSISPAVDPHAIAIQADQKIAVAGTCVIGSSLKFCVSRYNPDGLLDNTFDSDGLVMTDFDSSFGGLANDLSIQPDNKIVVGGQCFPPTGGVIPALARYNPDGSLDPGFDSDGRVTMPNSVQFEPTALALQSTKIVIVGRDFVTFDSAMAAARFNSDGSIDDTFGSGGLVTTPVGTLQSAANAVAVQTDGRIVSAGYSNFIFNFALGAAFSDFALVRYDTPVAQPVVGASVSGGGWIDSPAGAYAATPSLTGKANFAFVTKQQDGAIVPTGSLQFQFNAGRLKFQSTSFESLSVSGTQVQFEGAGTINGGGSYHFTVTAMDGDQPGGDGQDKFRIRISSDSDGLIYDNQVNTALGGGNIVIHH